MGKSQTVTSSFCTDCAAITATDWTGCEIRGAPPASSPAEAPPRPSLQHVTTYVAVFALVLAYAALVAAYCALRTLAKLRRATRILARGSRGVQGQESLIEATQRHAELTAETMDELTALKAEVERLRSEGLDALPAGAGDGSGALRNVALVRYDAFNGMSGRMSFSLALLDGHGDGVTVSAIAGQADTRVYAKGITAGSGEHELSPEEDQAVRAALQKRPRRLQRKSA